MSFRCSAVSLVLVIKMQLFATQIECDSLPPSRHAGCTSHLASDFLSIAAHCIEVGCVLISSFELFRRPLVGTSGESKARSVSKTGSEVVSSVRRKE